MNNLLVIIGSVTMTAEGKINVSQEDEIRPLRLWYKL